jgi:FixJ family two-component response regulator
MPQFLAGPNRDLVLECHFLYAGSIDGRPFIKRSFRHPLSKVGSTVIAGALFCRDDNSMTPSPTTNPTVFVVDDDEAFSSFVAGLSKALALEIQTFGTAAAFYRFYRPHMRGCLLLNVRLPRQNGLELYVQLLMEGKRLPVIFLAAHAEVSTAVAAMKTGALEFLEKPCERDVLVTLVRKAIQLDREWRTREEEFKRLSERLAKLTSSQRAILELIQIGKTNKAIAAKLAVTERAIEMRRSTIMRKLGARSVAELIDLVTTHRVLAGLDDISGSRRTY